MNEHKEQSYDTTGPAGKLSQEEEIQQQRWQEEKEDVHPQPSGQQTDKPHDDSIGDNKVSTSLDEDSAS